MSNKPNAYRSEEARLQAQRRMLAERYGLVDSDDEDDNASDSGSVSPPVDPVSSSPRVAMVKKNQLLKSHTAKISSSITTGNTFNALASLNDDEGSAIAIATPKKTTNTATTSTNSTVRSTPPVKMSPRVIRSSPPLSLGLTGNSAGGGDTAGPAVVFSCAKDGTLPSVYTYMRTEEQAAAGHYRKNPVMCVAKYASQFLPKHGRKVAVNDSVVTYVVGGHIRGIVRNSSMLSLLKGHTATVCDMEFLHATEKQIQADVSGSSFSPACSVLASVAEDGVAYVWRLLRTDAPEGMPKEEGTFAIADFIPIEHPDHASGSFYNRVALRPGEGSVVADNGIGVAMLLLDPQSPDVRVCEMVKMDEKIMARDTTLAAAKESHDSHAVDTTIPASACLWLDEKVAVVARGSSVLLWGFKDNECMGILPRSTNRAVQSLHNLGNRTILVAADEGKILEVWNIPENPAEEKSTLRQTVHVCDPASKDPFVGVVAVEPGHEIVTVANAKGSYMLVLHYDAARNAFDALTEVGTSQSMLSTTMTREKKKKQKIPAGRKDNDKDGNDEISMWFFQPNGIFTMTLNANQYAPKTSAEDTKTGNGDVNNSKAPTPTENTTANYSPSSQASNSSLTTGTKAFSLDAAQKNKLLDSARKSPIATVAAPTPTKKIEQPSLTTTPSKPAITILQPKRQQTTPPGDSNKDVEVKKQIITPRKLTLVKEEPTTDAASLNTATTEAPTGLADNNNTQAALTKEATQALEDELIESTLEGLNKVVMNFREKSRATEEMEAVRTKKLVLRLRDKAISNVDVAVNTAMKMAMEKIIINNVSEVLTRKIPNEKEIMATREEYISASIAASNILGMYRAGTQEILDQIMNTVDKSMDDKRTTLIDPAVRGITAASEDIAKTVSGFVAQLEGGAGLNFNGNRANGTQEKEAADIRPQVSQLIEQGLINEAFSSVLNMCDLALVDWLLVQFDPKTFFEAEKVSQVIALSLAQQIGHRLGTQQDPDCIVSVEWLRELMLYISPKDEDIEESAHESLSTLQKKVVGLQKDAALKEKYPAIGKQLKQLGLVIMSLAAE